MGLERLDSASTESTQAGNLPHSNRPSYIATGMLIGVLLFVAGVSLYDGYLVVRTGSMISEFEQNPVGRYLIKCDDGDVDIFLRVKAAGTLVSLVGLCLLHRHSRRLAGPVEFALVVFQGGLL